MTMGVLSSQPHLSSDFHKGSALPRKTVPQHTFFISGANCLAKDFCCHPPTPPLHSPTSSRSYLDQRWTRVSADFPLETSISPKLFGSYDYWALVEQLKRIWPCQLASGKRWSPRSKEKCFCEHFFSQRSWGLSKQVCCENLKRKEFLCLEAMAQRRQEWYNLKYVYSFHNVPMENLKEAFLFLKRPAYIYPSVLHGWA